VIAEPFALDELVRAVKAALPPAPQRDPIPGR
jgi:hypothetical protein